ncbi:hypothetical protein [Paraoerskovia marina]|uniref:Universal stress protein family protein n=1 Tax=Paraoerskovia marina TaxID=545619 RepID=A0A1H1SGV3_9CELL|nr:hypothetical protein [Paraoerskovia marina]SDS47038.1 hypothetical protein SAMN04489860_1622 [Paraoerskovia marina]
MTDTILVLSEAALAESDVQNLLSLYADRDVHFRLLVPADTSHDPVTSFIDYLSLGYLQEAWAAVTGQEPDPDEARKTADEQLAESLAAFTGAGADASGRVTDDDPLPSVATAVADHDASEIAVFTYPHAVEDTFHTDWASKARAAFDVPVLHVYLGTSELG